MINANKRLRLSPADIEILSAFEKEKNPYPYVVSTARKIMHMFEPDTIVLISPDEIYMFGRKDGLFKDGGTVSKTRSRYLYAIRIYRDWIVKKFEEGGHADTWFEPEWMEAHAV